LPDIDENAWQEILLLDFGTSAVAEIPSAGPENSGAASILHSPDPCR
jgi:hypothetical protein